MPNWQQNRKKYSNALLNYTFLFWCLMNLVFDFCNSVNMNMKQECFVCNCIELLSKPKKLLNSNTQCNTVHNYMHNCCDAWGMTVYSRDLNSNTQCSTVNTCIIGELQGGDDCIFLRSGWEFTKLLKANS